MTDNQIEELYTQYFLQEKELPLIFIDRVDKYRDGSPCGDGMGTIVIEAHSSAEKFVFLFNNEMGLHLGARSDQIEITPLFKGFLLKRLKAHIERKNHEVALTRTVIKHCD